MNHGAWATFTMKNYEDPVERAKIKKRLLDEYMDQGHSMPIEGMLLHP